MVKALINAFSENTYIIHNHSEAFIIDPGSNYKAMKKYLMEENLTLKGVLLSHGHYDHISGLNKLLHELDAPIYIHESERDFLFDPNLNLSVYMETRFKVKEKHAIKTIDEGDQFTIGDESIDVLHTPGHTRGGLTFKYKEYLFTGDALFRENIGRTDLPTGNQNTLIQSCKRLIDTFDQNTLVYPGHGPFTTIVHETFNNPFIKVV